MKNLMRAGSMLAFVAAAGPVNADDRDKMRTCLGMVNMATAGQQTETENNLQLFSAVYANDLDQVDGCLRRLSMPDDDRVFLMVNVRKLRRDLEFACRNPQRASEVAGGIVAAYPVRICSSREQ